MTTPNTEALFDIPEQKSPRLLWIEKHGIIAQPMGDSWYAWARDDAIQLSAEYDNPVDFHMGLYYPTLTGIAATEADAVTDWARKNHVKLWNEETL